MSVDSFDYFVHGNFHFHQQRCLIDDLSSGRAYDVHTENFAVFTVGNNLHETYVIAGCHSPAVGRKIETADTNIVFLTCLFFCQPNHCHLGVCVNHRRRRMQF
ncbi:hypothetical protein SDC9_175209 [bioreactor metagenome]|uniref:Uncharacterized protein n=1 Tax=bioreactor metagenome TaxID=1076179 RepID=A0A645GM29_9ZZZZ